MLLFFNAHVRGEAVVPTFLLLSFTAPNIYAYLKKKKKKVRIIISLPVSKAIIHPNYTADISHSLDVTSIKNKSFYSLYVL